MQESSSLLSTSENAKILTKITVHCCDKLKLSHLLVQPVVYMHIINSSQGSYIKKQDKNKAAVSFYETQRGDVDYIMPIMSNPCFVQGEKSQILKWEETFILNESLDYLVKKELSTILFFEVVDLAPSSITKDNYERLNENRMQKLAWAFLKLVGSNDIKNIGTKLRLQLYKSFFTPKKKKTSELDVFRWWSKGLKTPLQASLYISIEPHEIFSVGPALRSMLPLQEEATIATLENSSAKNNNSNTPVQDSNNSACTQNKSTIIWSRKEGEPCKIPTENLLSLPTASSCQILKFSTLGKFLVTANEISNQYFISFYEIPSGKFLLKKLAHSDVIYDFDWSKHDSNLLTASGDYSVKLWCIESWILKASFVHPSFVYAAKFQPSTKNILCTACYDHVVRIWTFNKTVQLLQELEGHNGSVNTLCWLTESIKLISADSNGQINVWKIPTSSKYSSNRGNFERYMLEKELDLQELKVTSVKKIINSIFSDILFVFCGDNVVRLVDHRNDEILFRYKDSVKAQNSGAGCCSPCGSLFFLSNQDGSISVWNTKTETIDAVMPNTFHSCQLSCIDYHPFEHMLAASSLEETIPVTIYAYKQKDSILDTLNEVAHSESSVKSTNVLQDSKSSHKSKNLPSLSNKSDIKDLTAKQNMYTPEKSVKPSSRKYRSDLYSHDTKGGGHFYESDSSISQRSFENMEKSEKSETLTAIITKSGKFDVLAITDSSSKSDCYGSQSSTSDPPPVIQRSSKRSQRRRKLKELNKC